MKLACVLLGGHTYTIDGMPFEWHPRLGPVLLSKKGQILAQQPGPHHHFWKATSRWREQGCLVRDDGACIYEEPPEPVYVQILGRHYAEVPPGRAPEDVRREWLAKLDLGSQP